MKKFITITTTFLICLCGLVNNTKAQVAINTDGSVADTSSILHVKSVNKGLIIPNISLLSITDVVTINTPAISLMIFNTNNTLPLGRGYYYWSGTQWIKLLVSNDLSSLNYWSHSGNSGTTSSNFIGTTDLQPLKFRTNNQLAGFLDNAKFNYVFGLTALNSNTTGTSNIALGSDALSNNTTGYSNVALGHDALNKNTTFSNLVAVGDSTLFNNGVGATGLQGTQNTAIGSKTLFANTTGKNNTSMGFQSLNANTTGSSNVAIGNK